jgi:hypothetical protein
MIIPKPEIDELHRMARLVLPAGSARSSSRWRASKSGSTVDAGLSALREDSGDSTAPIIAAIEARGEP